LIDESPPPLRNRKPPDPELLALRRAAVGRPVIEIDLYRQWNSRYLPKGCAAADQVLASLPPPLFVFDPPEENEQPIYRFLPDVTTPLGLVTNRFGWRGPDVPLDKPARTIRIAFVGASTTVGAHDFPFSYPELVIHWLNVWAAHAGRRVRFDGINAGREGLASPSFAAIVRQELLPMEPDLVVYYEGANQFSMSSLTGKPPPTIPRTLTNEAGLWNDIAAPLRPYSSLVRRVDRARNIWAAGDGSEPPRAPAELTWPPGVDELNPDIDRPNLPLQLSNIVHDLDGIRADLRSIGADFAVSSFVWLVWDGMRLDPVRDTVIYTALKQRWPYRYADIRRAADFQNRVYARYAASRDVPFLDVSSAVPRDPALFIDPIHFSPSGIRVQAWAVLNALVPHIEHRLAAHVWPRRDRMPLVEHPGIAPPRRIAGCPAAAPIEPGRPAPTQARF
jgi:hypothetical protein